jgi:signal peptidase I
MSDTLTLCGALTPGERVEFVGVYDGPMEVLARGDGVVVLKHDGHHYYRGQGQPWGYARAKVAVYRVLIVGRDNAYAAQVVKLCEWPVRGG